MPHLRFSTALFAALAGERRATRYHPCTDPSVVGSGQAEGWIAQSLARDQSDDDVDDVDDGDEDVGDDDDDVSGADG